MGSRVAHAHMSDATDKKLHLRIGEGMLDFAAIAQALRGQGFSGVCSLETYIPGDEEALAEERKKLDRIFR